MVVVMVHGGRDGDGDSGDCGGGTWWWWWCMVVVMIFILY